MSYLNDYLANKDFKGALAYLQSGQAQAFEFVLQCYPVNANALIYCSALGQIELVQLMLERYFKFLNMQSVNDYGMSAFLVAVMQNQVPIIDLLLQHGAKIDDQDSWKREALEVAVTFNSNEALIYLLKVKNINKKNYSEAHLGEGGLVFKSVMIHHVDILDSLLKDDYFFNVAWSALRKLKNNQHTNLALFLEAKLEKQQLENVVMESNIQLTHKI